MSPYPVWPFPIRVIQDDKGPTIDPVTKLHVSATQLAPVEVEGADFQAEGNIATENRVPGHALVLMGQARLFVEAQEAVAKGIGQGTLLEVWHDEAGVERHLFRVKSETSRTYGIAHSVTGLNLRKRFILERADTKKVDREVES